MTETDIEVRRCRRAETDQAAVVLARAFLDDPLYAWAFPGRDRRARLLPHYMRSLPLTAYGRSGLVRIAAVGDAVVGVLVECGPGRPEPARTAMLRALPATVRAAGPAGTRRLFRLDAAVATVRPARAHRYLFHLGADPGWAGRGVGSALLRAALADSDAEGVPTHLECGPDAVAYYGRRGFGVTGPVPFGPVALRGMVREPGGEGGGGRGGS